MRIRVIGVSLAIVEARESEAERETQTSKITILVETHGTRSEASSGLMGYI